MSTETTSCASPVTRDPGVTLEQVAADGIPVAVARRVLSIARQVNYRWLAQPVTDAELEHRQWSCRVALLVTPPSAVQETIIVIPGVVDPSSIAPMPTESICRKHPWSSLAELQIKIGCVEMAYPLAVTLSGYFRLLASRGVAINPELLKVQNIDASDARGRLDALGLQPPPELVYWCAQFPRTGRLLSDPGAGTSHIVPGLYPLGFEEGRTERDMLLRVQEEVGGWPPSESTQESEDLSSWFPLLSGPTRVLIRADGNVPEVALWHADTGFEPRWESLTAAVVEWAELVQAGHWRPLDAQALVWDSDETMF